tara:strand:+ start:181 stop:381 length:201 start_codon:yes stop_codon:yes gene_type:complete
MNIDKKINLSIEEMKIIKQLIEKDIIETQDTANLILKEKKSKIEDYEERIDRISILKYTLMKLKGI